MKYKKYEPKRATLGSAGYDFCAPAEYTIEPGKWTTIDTGVALTNDDCPIHFMRWFMMVVPRSGISFNYGLRIINTVAIIDMDYRDTIKLKVTTDAPYTLAEGERFAQGIILPFDVFEGEIKPTGTRSGGFGSTGRI